jgi:hypothetical protein
MGSNISQHPQLEAITAMLETNTIKATAEAFNLSEDAMGRFKAKLTAQKLREPPPDVTPDSKLETPTVNAPRRVTAGYTHPRDPQTLEPLIKAARAEIRRTRDALEDLTNTLEQTESTARETARTAPSDLDQLEQMENRLRATRRGVEAAQAHHDEAILALADLENEVRAFHRDLAIWKYAKEFMAIIEEFDQEYDTFIQVLTTARATFNLLRESALEKHYLAMGQGLLSRDPAMLRLLLLEHGLSGRALDLLMIEATLFKQYENNHPILSFRKDLNKVFFEGKV